MNSKNAILNAIASNEEFDTVSAPYNHELFLSRKGKAKGFIKLINEEMKSSESQYVIKVPVEENWFKRQVGGDYWILSRTEMSRLRAMLERSVEKNKFPVRVSRTIIKYQPIVNFSK